MEKANCLRQISIPTAVGVWVLELGEGENNETQSSNEPEHFNTNKRKLVGV